MLLRVVLTETPCSPERQTQHMTMPQTPNVHFELFSSTFCGACAHTRAVLSQATKYLPRATVTEIDIAQDPKLAESQNIESTPTVIVRNGHGEEVFRATGVPTLNHILTAAVRSLDS